MRDKFTVRNDLQGKLDRSISCVLLHRHEKYTSHCYIDARSVEEASGSGNIDNKVIENLPSLVLVQISCVYKLQGRPMSDMSVMWASGTKADDLPAPQEADISAMRARFHEEQIERS